MLILIVSFAIVSAEQPEPAGCTTTVECRRLALEAMERQEYEDAHTLAWRAVRSGPPNDPELMELLARTQSLSGRPQDALIMLRRLADRGVGLVEAETHDDFRRVRSLPGWPEVLSRIYAAAGIKREVGTPPAATATAPPPTSPAPSPPVSTPSPATTPTPVTPTPVTPTPPPPVAAPAPPPPPAAKRTKEKDDAPRPSTATAAEVLKIPAALFRPKALDFDVVSQRFVVVEDGSDTVKVVDVLAGNAVNLVSRGWAGAYLPTALAIDRRRGDLWVAGAHESDGMSRAALHRLQLVSGRLLSTIELPRESGAARFVDIAMNGSSVLLLDAIGRRVLELEAGARALKLHRKLDVTIDPVSLTPADEGVIYVAHADGIVRVDPAARGAVPLKGSTKITLAGLQWIREHNGSLVGILGRRDGSRAAVRITLDRRGGTASALEVLDQAGSRAASIADGVFYYIGDERVGGSAPLRRVKLN